MLHAVNDAHTKSSRGLLATGVMIAVCRHSCIRPNSAADLQRGERYVILEHFIVLANVLLPIGT